MIMTMTAVIVVWITARSARTGLPNDVEGPLAGNHLGYRKEIPSHSRIGSSGILDLTAEGSHGVHASVCLRNVLGSGSRSTRAAMQGRANAVRDVA